MGRDYFRHPTGGGKIWSFQVDASLDSYIDEQSQVGHGARILGGARISNSKIAGSARIFGARIISSEVGLWLNDENGEPLASQPPFPIIEGAGIVIEKSIVMCEEVSSICNSLYIRSSELYEKAAVRDQACLRGTIVRGRARIVGDARVLGTPEENIILDSLVHIHTGTWHTAPRYAEIGGEGEDGINVGITECTEGRINVGCWCRTTEQWLARKRWRLPLALGWTAEQIREAQGIIEQWRDDAN